MSANKILIADDDKVVHESLGIYLKSEGFEVVDVYDGKAAVDALDSDIALCVLDIMMPEMSGLDVCREIRKTSRVPVIMLTAKGEEIDRILGLELGADDYIVKPFSIEELLLKMEVFLNRSQKTKQANKVIQLGHFLFDAQNYSLRINEETILLTQRESELLKLFTENKDTVLTREIILKKLWGDDDYFMGRSLDVFISRLRKILMADKNVQIENLHGIGFRFTIK